MLADPRPSALCGRCSLGCSKGTTGIPVVPRQKPMRVQVVLRTLCTRSFAKSAGRCSPLRTPCTRSFATCARRCSRRRTPCTHSFAACPVLILLRPPRAFFFLQVPPPSCWSGAAPLLLHPPCFLSLCSPRRCSPSELVLTFSAAICPAPSPSHSSRCRSVRTRSRSARQSRAGTPADPLLSNHLEHCN